MGRPPSQHARQRERSNLQKSKGNASAYVHDKHTSSSESCVISAAHYARTLPHLLAIPSRLCLTWLRLVLSHERRWWRCLCRSQPSRFRRSDWRHGSRLLAHESHARAGLKLLDFKKRRSSQRKNVLVRVISYHSAGTTFTDTLLFVQKSRPLCVPLCRPSRGER